MFDSSPFGREKRRRAAVARRRTIRLKRMDIVPINRRIGGFTGIENKFFDVETATDAFSGTWATMEPATTNLTAVGQGDGESNRDGRRYAIRSIHLRGEIRINAAESQTTPKSDELCRIVLVWDSQTNGAQLTATDVMDGSGTNDFLSLRNLQFTKRFRVLFDKSFHMNTGPANMNEGAANLFAHGLIFRHWKYNKTFNPPIPVTMSGTTADIANVTDNSIHMIGVGTSTTSLLSYQCRIRFVG